MKISLQWLNRYIDLHDYSIDKISDTLTSIGLEVEGIEDQSQGFQHIVVAEVVSCEKHPDADKLTVCRVADGKSVLQVICGAPNVRAGQKVALAQVGASLKRVGLNIVLRTVRGQESCGMLCSSNELGLDEDHSGILVLDEDALVGMPLSQYLDRNDISFEIGITPNRGDALSHLGVARDLSAAFGLPLQYPIVPELPARPASFSVDLQDEDLCPRYSAAVIRNISVQPSPRWMQKLLEAAGMRSINNIVDATNFVMLEIGQPMHAFDLSFLEDRTIVIRPSNAGDTFCTLDGVDRSIPGNALYICDGRKPVALAGVMGGLDSAINDKTTDILLESAYFNPASIRRTSKSIGLSTDSSYRFERGTDPDITVWALQRAVQLILEIAGGSFESCIDAYPKRIEPNRIVLRPDKVDEILGVRIPDDFKRSILSALQIDVADYEGKWICTGPTFRSDIAREIDLIEEIGRIFGYDKIPTPQSMMIDSSEHYDSYAFEGQLRDIFLGFGFDEILSSSLVSRSHASLVETEGVIDVLNPVSAERPSLRTTLITSLLEAVDHNIRNGTKSLRIFEIGTVFSKERNESGSYMEYPTIAFAMTGNAQEREWYSPARDYDFYDAKGVAESLFRKLHTLNDVSVLYRDVNSVFSELVSYSLASTAMGQVGTLSPAVLETFRIDQPVFSGEFRIPGLQSSESFHQKYSAIVKYPVVSRDIAFLVHKDVIVQDILDTVRFVASDLLFSMKVLDIFTHDSFGKDMKSVALTCSFQSAQKTLTEDEIAIEMERIIAELEKDHHVSIRS